MILAKPHQVTKLLTFLTLLSSVSCSAISQNLQGLHARTNSKLSAEDENNKFTTTRDPVEPILVELKDYFSHNLIKNDSTQKELARREAKLISMLMMIRLESAPCAGDNGSNGTCYPRNQCLQLGGTGSGTCAAGFGVCCVFQKTCNSETNQNVTYFTNPDYPGTYDGSIECPLTVQKVDTNVCQYRLDFEEFTLAQPEPVDHICESDVFVVAGGRPVPPICGENAGQHMYIDAGPSSGNIKINIVTSGDSFARKWKIKISQIPCNAQYRAADSCLQYFTGMSGRIKSFNYGDPALVNTEQMDYGMQLSAQEYSICMRAEEGFCGIVYVPCRDTADTKETFMISSTTQGAPTMPTMVPGMSPGLNPDMIPGINNISMMLMSTSTATPHRTMSGAEQCPSDWVGIPCATDTGREIQTDGSSCIDRICGGTFSSLSGSLSHAPVYSFSRPFNIRVHFNDFEMSDHQAPDEKNRGVCLDYVQQPCPQYGRTEEADEPWSESHHPILDPFFYE